VAEPEQGLLVATGQVGGGVGEAAAALTAQRLVSVPVSPSSVLRILAENPG
jgi:hypothetical protein